MARGNAVTRINYALAATLLAQGQTMEQAALATGAKNGSTLRVGLHRRGVTQKLARSAPEVRAVARAVSTNVTLQLAHQASDILKESSNRTRKTLADATETLASVVLDQKRPRTDKEIQSRAETILTTARAGALIHGWDADRNNTLVLTGVLSGSINEDPAIDVQSVPVTPGTTDLEQV